MLPTTVLPFLRTLKENNTREWFHANKNMYDKARKDFEGFVSQVIPMVATIDKSVAYLEPKDCIFRIFRDTRFSNDKTPYKTNMGAWMVQGGRKSPLAGYYIHIEPDGCFLAGGVYMPMPDVLKKIRTEIYENADEFLEIINNEQFIKYFGKLDEEQMLKTAPKDFPKTFEHVNLLRYKSYTVTRLLTEEMLYSNQLFDEIINTFNALKSLNTFINNALTNS